MHQRTMSRHLWRSSSTDFADDWVSRPGEKPTRREILFELAFAESGYTIELAGQGIDEVGRDGENRDVWCVSIRAISEPRGRTSHEAIRQKPMKSFGLEAPPTGKLFSFPDLVSEMGSRRSRGR